MREKGGLAFLAHTRTIEKFLAMQAKMDWCLNVTYELRIFLLDKFLMILSQLHVIIYVLEIVMAMDHHDYSWLSSTD
jgi:hypothetical protein